MVPPLLSPAESVTATTTTILAAPGSTAAENDSEDDAAATTQQHGDAEDSDSGEFVVDRILEQRNGKGSRKGRIEYLVAWVGYSDQTWEVESTLADTQAFEVWMPQ